MFSTNHNEGLPDLKRSTSRGQALTEIFCGKSNMEKKKREMTPEMLETLARARQRAVEVRRERAELKRKEKELRHLEEATKADNINERYAKVASRSKQPVHEPEPEPEQAPTPARKRKSKPKPKEKPKEPPLEQAEYDTEEEDVSESEPDEPAPPPKTKRRPPRPQQQQQPAVNPALEEAYQSLFRYRY